MPDSTSNGTNKLIKWIGIILTILIIAGSTISTYAVIKNQVAVNCEDIREHDQTLKNHETRIATREALAEERKEQLNRIENKLDKALGIKE